jgi:MFS family permease
MIGLSLASFFAFFSSGSIATIMPLYVTSLGISLSLLGTIPGSPKIVRVFLSYFVGIVTDRIGRRIPLTLGFLLFATGILFIAVADGYSLLILGRIIWGVGTAFVLVCSAAVVTDLSSSRERGRFFSLLQGAQYISLALSPVFGGFLQELLGWKQMLTISTILSFFALAFCFFTIRETKLANMRGYSGSNGGLTKGFALLAKEAKLGLIGLANFSVWFSIVGTLNTMFALYCFHRGIVSTTLIGFLVTFEFLPVGMLSYVSGHLSDRTDRRFLIATGLVLAIIGFSSLASSETLVMLLISVVLIGMGRGLLTSPMSAFASEIPPLHLKGTGLGAFATLGDVGGGLGGLLSPIFVAAFGFEASFLACVAMLFFGLALTLATHLFN